MKIQNLSFNYQFSSFQGRRKKEEEEGRRKKC
jgi:hypothetical protein